MSALVPFVAVHQFIKIFLMLAVPKKLFELFDMPPSGEPIGWRA